MRPNVIKNLLQFLLIGTLLMSLKTQAQNIQVSMLTPPGDRPNQPLPRNH